MSESEIIWTNSAGALVDEKDATLGEVWLGDPPMPVFVKPRKDPPAERIVEHGTRAEPDIIPKA